MGKIRIDRLTTLVQNDPNGLFVDADGVYHLYYQCMKEPSFSLNDRVYLQKARLLTIEKKKTIPLPLLQAINTGATQQQPTAIPLKTNQSPCSLPTMKPLSTAARQ
jgi:hypothetical protein